MDEQSIDPKLARVIHGLSRHQQAEQQRAVAKQRAASKAPTSHVVCVRMPTHREQSQ